MPLIGFPLWIPMSGNLYIIKGVACFYKERTIKHPSQMFRHYAFRTDEMFCSLCVILTSTPNFLWICSARYWALYTERC